MVAVYTILERGEEADLALVKFTQERGAASTFYRVVAFMESVLEEANLILTDSEKHKKIIDSVDRAGL